MGKSDLRWFMWQYVTGCEKALKMWKA